MLFCTNYTNWKRDVRSLYAAVGYSTKNTRLVKARYTFLPCHPQRKYNGIHKHGGTDQRPPVARASCLDDGKQLDASSSGREEVFRATVDSQWALLASEEETQLSSLSAQGDGDGDGALPKTRENTASSASPGLRSPFLVCADRHPDAILALESVVHRARTQLAYSRGDTACLLAGLRLDEVEAVRLSEGVHAIEPLPQPAKLSRSLHAKLEDPLEPSSGRGSERRDKKRGSGARQPQQQPPRAGNVRFNHGEGPPSDLDVSLTPGIWGLDMVHSWTEHLTSFETAAHLWDEHLRQRFLWTRRSTGGGGEAAAGHSGGGAGDNERKKRRGLADDGAQPLSVPGTRRARNALVETHGLEDLERLWEQTAEHSGQDGGCDFGRLRASSASGDSNIDSDTKGFGGKPKPRHERGRPNGRTGSARKDSASTEEAGGDNHDRVVLRGVSSLGITPQDNAHCLLTVLAYLATRPEVAYLDELPQVFELNVEAAWITQSGEETAYSIWDQGIDGRTEVRDTARGKDTLVLLESKASNNSGARSDVLASWFSCLIYGAKQMYLVHTCSPAVNSSATTRRAFE